jgi:hypothetical protein
MIFQRSGRPALLGVNGQREHALLLWLATTAIFGVVLSLSWRTRVEAQCQTFGNNYCVNPDGTNPCPYTTCTATGSGYTCVVGTTSPPELSYSMNNQPSVWPRCYFNPASSGHQHVCNENGSLCGPIEHYTTSTTAMCVAATCTGSWVWNGCYATGTCN